MIWGFYQSEQYRTQTNLSLSETYEVLWRCSQIREKAANIGGMMASPEAARGVDVKLKYEMQLLKFNIAALRGLPYFDKFFSSADAQNLDRAQELIAEQIFPTLEQKPVDEVVVSQFAEIRTSMYAVTGTAISSGRGLGDRADIEDRARTNGFIVALVLAALIIVVAFALQRMAFAKKFENFVKSFFSLQAHMTRTRLSGLVLFIRRLHEGQPVAPSMVEAARHAAEELTAINEGLHHIAASRRPKEFVQFQTILEQLSETHPGHILREMSEEALRAKVAAPHVHMVLDELVQNSRRALEAAGQEASAIIVRGKVVTKFLFQKVLALEVIDRGVGMSPEVQQEAIEPFYSTRAGPHVGLGLTGCNEILRALGGTLKIFSVEGEGTTVRVVYPLRSAGLETGATP